MFLFQIFKGKNETLARGVNALRNMDEEVIAGPKRQMPEQTQEATADSQKQLSGRELLENQARILLSGILNRTATVFKTLNADDFIVSVGTYSRTSSAPWEDEYAGKTCISITISENKKIFYSQGYEFYPLLILKKLLLGEGNLLTTTDEKIGEEAVPLKITILGAREPAPLNYRTRLAQILNTKLKSTDLAKE